MLVVPGVYSKTEVYPGRPAEFSAEGQQPMLAQACFWAAWVALARLYARTSNIGAHNKPQIR